MGMAMTMEMTTVPRVQSLRPGSDLTDNSEDLPVALEVAQVGEGAAVDEPIIDAMRGMVNPLFGTFSGSLRGSIGTMSARMTGTSSRTVAGGARTRTGSAGARNGSRNGSVGRGQSGADAASASAATARVSTTHRPTSARFPGDLAGGGSGRSESEGWNDGGEYEGEEDGHEREEKAIKMNNFLKAGCCCWFVLAIVCTLAIVKPRLPKAGIYRGPFEQDAFLAGTCGLIVLCMPCCYLFFHTAFDGRDEKCASLVSGCIVVQGGIAMAIFSIKAMVEGSKVPFSPTHSFVLPFWVLSFCMCGGVLAFHGSMAKAAWCSNGATNDDRDDDRDGGASSGGVADGDIENGSGGGGGGGGVAEIREDAGGQQPVMGGGVYNV